MIRNNLDGIVDLTMLRNHPGMAITGQGVNHNIAHFAVLVADFSCAATLKT